MSDEERIEEWMQENRRKRRLRELKKTIAKSRARGSKKSLVEIETLETLLNLISRQYDI